MTILLPTICRILLKKKKKTPAKTLCRRRPACYISFLRPKWTYVNRRVSSIPIQFNLCNIMSCKKNKKKKSITAVIRNVILFKFFSFLIVQQRVFVHSSLPFRELSVIIIAVYENIFDGNQYSRL